MSTAVAPREQNLLALLTSDGAATRIAPFLPKGVSIARVVAATQLAIKDNPALLQCEPDTIIRSVARIQQWGLEIGVTAHLVPFGNKCTAIADYKGYAELMMASGAVRHVTARAVYKTDQFEYEQGLTPTLTHVPNSDPATRGPLRGAYAILRLPFGRSEFEYMPIEDIDAIRQKYSKQWKEGPCPEWYAKKTVVRQIAKLVPKNPRLAALLRVVEEDELEEFDEPPVAIVDSPTSTPASTAGAPAATAATPVAETPVETPVETPAAKPPEKPAAEKLFPMNGPFKGKPLGELHLDVITGYIDWIRKKQAEKSDETFFGDLLAALVEVAAAKKAEAERHQTKLELGDTPAKPQVSTAGYGGDSEQLSPEQLAKAGDVAAQASDPMQAPPARGAREEAKAAVGTSTSVPMPAPGAVSDALTPQPPDPAPLARAKEKVREAEKKTKAGEKKPHSVDDGRGPLPFDEEPSI